MVTTFFYYYCILLVLLLLIALLLLLPITIINLRLLLLLLITSFPLMSYTGATLCSRFISWSAWKIHEPLHAKTRIYQRSSTSTQITRFFRSAHCASSTASSLLCVAMRPMLKQFCGTMRGGRQCSIFAGSNAKDEQGGEVALPLRTGRGRCIFHAMPFCTNAILVKGQVLLFFIDFEATGIDVTQDRVVELAACSTPDDHAMRGANFSSVSREPRT